MGTRFSHASKEISRNQVDFKEVYKWIMSPLFVRETGVHANLDGQFLIQVNFCNRGGDSALEESAIVQAIEEEIQGMGVGKQRGGGAKWKQKKENKGRENQ